MNSKSSRASEKVELGALGAKAEKKEDRSTKYELVGERRDEEERQQAEKELGLGSRVPERGQRE